MLAQTVDLWDLKMAQVIISIKIMPESPEVDLGKIEGVAKEAILSAVGEGEIKAEVNPVAFGLNSLDLIFVMNESDKLDPIEESIGKIDGVNSVEVTDVRRAIG